MIRSSVLALLLLAVPASAAAPPLAAADQTAAFKAAGFTQKAGKWVSECDQPDGPPYTPGAIEQVADLNGDGRPEAVVTEGSSFCYGHTETGFKLVSKQANGSWRLVYASEGIPHFLTTRANGWPELEVGGPGFCFPVRRWNGSDFVNFRFQYEGKPCKPQR